MDTVNKLLKQGHKFENTCFGGELKDWGFDPVAAQCYLGGTGIAEAFRQGADIVICGRWVFFLLRRNENQRLTFDKVCLTLLQSLVPQCITMGGIETRILTRLPDP